MNGTSLGEILMIGIVVLVAVGPQKLPGMLRTLGQWIRKLKRMTYDVRAQSGIDEILRAEGLQDDLSELRSFMRGQHIGRYAAMTEASAPVRSTSDPYADPYADLEVDPTREYPPEGPDAYQALPDDLVDEAPEPSPSAEPFVPDEARVTPDSVVS